MTAITYDESPREKQKSPFGAFVFLIMVLVLGGLTLASFSRHSDTNHDPRFSSEAKVSIQDVSYKVNNWLRDPKTGPVLYCGIAVIKSGATQYRLYDVVTGWTFFFQDGAWTSAFPGKTPFQFLEGNPRGASSYTTYNPASGGDALQACKEIFTKAPSPGSFR